MEGSSLLTQWAPPPHRQPDPSGCHWNPAGQIPMRDFWIAAAFATAFFFSASSNCLSYFLHLKRDLCLDRVGRKALIVLEFTPREWGEREGTRSQEIWFWAGCSKICGPRQFNVPQTDIYLDALNFVVLVISPSTWWSGLPWMHSTMPLTYLHWWRRSL